MCRKVASASVDDGIVNLSVSCLEHGNLNEIPIPVESIPDFLSEGFFGMTIGAVSPQSFYTIVDALVEAGVNVPGDYRRN